QDFEKLIQGAKPARHVDESDAVFHETNLARKEVVEMKRDIGEAVAGLLMGKFNIEAHGTTVGLRGALVCGFHDSRAAACDHSELMLGQAPGQRHGRLVVWIVGARAGRAKNS